MKNKFIFLLFTFTFCLLSFSFLFGQDTWTKTYNPFCEEYIPDMGWIELEVDYEVEDVLVTQDGGYVVSGSFDRWIDDDPPFWFDHWGFLMKTDCDGNLLWAKGDSVVFMDENGYEVNFTETEDGDFISIGDDDFGGGYMIKRDSEGNREWAIPYHPAEQGLGVFSMQTTEDHNIILAGRSNYNATLRKITPDGVTIWTQVYDVGSSMAYSVYQRSDGGYLLTGISFPGDDDILVIKTNANGDSLWTRTFDGYGDNDYGYCIIETSEENYISVGRVRNAKSYYGIIIKLDTLGDILWTKILDDGLLHWIGSAVQTKDNNYVVQGGKLVKIDENQNVIWEEPLVGQVFGGGDRNLQEISDGGFICTSVINWGDYIVLNKTDSLGQIYSIEEPGNQNNISINIFPNPILDNCTILFNNYITLKDPHITVYNIKGQKIRELKVENNVLGIHEINWDGKSFDGKEVHNGIYFIKLERDNDSIVKKVTKIK